MTTADWLASRRPAPSPDLALAISKAVQMVPADDRDVPGHLVEAVRALAPRVAAADCADRGSALDLLVLDALITYAMEASCDSASQCEKTTRALLAAIGSAAAAK